jgi:hypothetical protein
MRHRNPNDRRCTYLLVIEHEAPSADELRSLAEYLSTVGVAGGDVVIVDASAPPEFERNRRSLRWVGRHIAPRTGHRGPNGSIDPIRAAIDLNVCDKVIIAGANVRYSEEALGAMCDLLDLHEAVEPQDYFDPLPWWGSIEAGRMLVHRGIEPLPDHGATFGVRKAALRGLRTIDAFTSPGEDHVRRLAAVGVEVHSASDCFVRRLPPALGEWMEDRPRQADDDFSLPAKTAFFFALIPMALLLAAFGGMRIAGGYAGAIAFGSLALALRGRAGAAPFFPLRACLAAPLWVLERSVSVYWALYRKLRGFSYEADGLAAPAAASSRIASGE